MGDPSQQTTQLPLRAALYARLSETYDAAESVPTQLTNAERHAGGRGWRVVAVQGRRVLGVQGDPPR